MIANELFKDDRLVPIFVLLRSYSTMIDFSSVFSSWYKKNKIRLGIVAIIIAAIILAVVLGAVLGTRSKSPSSIDIIVNTTSTTSK